MHAKTRETFLAAFVLVLIVSLSGCISGQLTGNVVNSAKAGETKIVTKVIDGDTIIVEGGDHVRLLGIDSDEKGYPCYTPAKKRIEELVLGKEVYLEPDAEDKDQYDRLLRYIFLDGRNINIIMVEEGFAVARFYPENTKYKDEIIAAEQEDIDSASGCKWASD